MLSVYAKMMELSNTIALFDHPQPELSIMSSQARNTQPADILGISVSIPEVPPGTPWISCCLC
ncbi:MAG: hypothetical protein ACLRT5_05545 [Lachnospiraceae bacterium]